MAIWATKTNTVGVEIWPFLYLILIRYHISLPDDGEGCVTHFQKNPIKNKNPFSLITHCVIHNFFSSFLSRNTLLLLGNSVSCTLLTTKDDTIQKCYPLPNTRLPTSYKLGRKIHSPCVCTGASSSFGRIGWQPVGREWALYCPTCATDAKLEH